MMSQPTGSVIASQLATIEGILNDPDARKDRDRRRIEVSRLLRAIADGCVRKEDRVHIGMIKKDCDTFFGDTCLSEERTDCRALIAFHLKALRKNLSEQPMVSSADLAA